MPRHGSAKTIIVILAAILWNSNTVPTRNYTAMRVSTAQFNENRAVRDCMGAFVLVWCCKAPCALSNIAAKVYSQQETKVLGLR